MLKTAHSYEEACRTFRWHIPERYNLAFGACDRQSMAGADGHRTALIVEDAEGGVERYTFHVLRLLSNRLANVLAALGVTRGDAVLVSFPASLEAALAILAVIKMGAVAVPVPVELGSEFWAWRLEESGARVAITAAGRPAAAAAAAREHTGRPLALLAAGDPPPGGREFWTALNAAADSFAPVVTDANDPALLIFPPDSHGRPPGALLPHRALLGNLPAVEFAFGFFPQFGDIITTSADWMTFEALFWSILPAWHHGVPVVALAGPRDEERMLAGMARHGVRVAYLPAATLMTLTAAAAHHPHSLPRLLVTGPDSLTTAEFEEVRRAFGVGANEIWGMCESGALVANNARLMERRSTSPGRAAPGITVEAMDDRSGRVLRAGQRGVLAAAPGAPGAFLGYRGDGPTPVQLLDNGWLLTGRLGSRDLDGYVWPEPLALPQGISLVGGWPVVLAEMDATLSAHALVSEAATAILPSGEIRAFVVPIADTVPDGALAKTLRDWMIARRSLREAPTRIEFVSELPRSQDGTMQREALAIRPLRLDAPLCVDDRWVTSRKK